MKKWHQQQQQQQFPSGVLTSCLSVWLALLLSGLLSSCNAWVAVSSSSSSSSGSFSPLHHRSSSTTTMSASSSSSSSSPPVDAASSSQTSANPLPRLPLPPPILSNVPDTWAYDTMSRRVNEEILERTWQDNQEAWSSNDKFATVRARFEALRNELSHAATTKLTHLETEAASPKEATEWRELLEPFVQQEDTWLTAPWMVTEFYVYRRLMQALGYWDRDSAGYQYDPFDAPKRAGLVSSVASAEAVLVKIPSLPSSPAGLTLAASIALWGNKMDLSLWPADATAESKDIFSNILAAASENLLHDDSVELAAYCEQLRTTAGGGAVDIIVDNAGFELVTDLALAQYLIQSGTAHTVTFQLKSHPTFVSDALEKDLLETVEYYQQLDPEQYPAAQAAGAVWKQYLQDGKWQCHEDNFWVQPYAMWDMTEPLRSDLVNRCDLAFVKGDANYRRLLGDRLWDWTAPFGDVVGAYFPCPVCALRTLKAELGCGMDAKQIERAQSLDDNWMVNGRFGVVQFGPGAEKPPKQQES